MEFINRDRLKKHIESVVDGYERQLREYDLKKFNSQIIDPIKLTFDSKVYGKDMETIIEEEINRQRDKSNNNLIGYFHHNIFRYIDKCTVPQEGFDVIFEDEKTKIYVEMKNKHNTMNSSNAKEIYKKMERKIKEENDCICALVEIIATKSQNIPWVIGGQKNEKIRRISIDKFYEIVTGDKNSFFWLCKEIPIILDEIMKERIYKNNPKNKVIEELLLENKNLTKSIFQIAFKEYMGFKN